MTNYKIESGIPVPTRFHYPFSTMKPRDSFFITTSQPKEIAAVRSAISYYKRHHKGTNFVSRIQREANLITGIRIFRTS
jgi:restriction endonuclease Mrr